MSKANTVFDQWVVCPKCRSAMVGEIGEVCILCKDVVMVATPLFPAEDAPVPQAESAEAICAELGIEYTDEEKAILDELGL